MITMDQLKTARDNAVAAGDAEAAKKIEAVISREASKKPIGVDYDTLFANLDERYGKPEEEPGFLENVGTGFMSGLVGTGESAALGAATLLEEEDELAAREKIKAVANRLRPEGGDQESISYLVSSGLGSIAGSLAPAALAAAAPISAPTAGLIGLGGAAAIGIGAGAGEASERARAYGATEEERNKAIPLGAGVGVLEVAPLGRILKIPFLSDLVTKLGPRAVEEGGSRILSAAQTGGLEAAQEVAAGILQNAIEQGYNPEKELIDAGLKDEAIAGGGAGAIIQALVDTVVKGRAGRQGDAQQGLADAEQGLADAEQETEELLALPAPRPELPPSQDDLQAAPLSDFSDEEIYDTATQLIDQGVPEAEVTPELIFDTLVSKQEEKTKTEAAERDALETEAIQEFERQDEAARAQEAEAMELEALELEIQGEEAYNEAVAELEKVSRVSRTEERQQLEVESEQESAQLAEQGAEQAAAMRPRQEALEAVIAEPTTGSYVNLEKKFARELDNRNIAKGEKAKPTPEESAQIKRAADAFAGVRQGPRLEQAPQKSRPITEEVMDSLNVPPRSPIRKRVIGKDLNDPAVQQEFVKYVKNPRVPEITRDFITKELGGVDGQPGTTQQEGIGTGLRGDTPDMGLEGQVPGQAPATGGIAALTGRGMDASQRGAGPDTGRAGGQRASLEEMMRFTNQTLEERLASRTDIPKGGAGAQTQTKKAWRSPSYIESHGKKVAAKKAAPKKPAPKPAPVKKKAPAKKTVTPKQRRTEVEGKAKIQKELHQAELKKLSRGKSRGKRLDPDAVVMLDTPLEKPVLDAIADNNLSGALESLANSTSDKRMRQIANRMVKVAGDTKIAVVQNLKSEDGRPAAGVFDPETNTIKLDAETGTNPHTLLHEMTHAGVSATLAKKNHPLTKQMNKLFDDVKPMLDSAYGAANVDEFVSEAMSNPKFQDKLRGIYPNGKDISAFERFANSVSNFVRKLLGMQTKPLDSALTEVDRLIQGLLTPAPKYREGAELPMFAGREGVLDTMRNLGRVKTDLGRPTRSSRDKFVDTVAEFGRSGITRPVKAVAVRLLDSQALADVAEKVGLGDLGMKLHKAFNDQRGAMDASDVSVKRQVVKVERLVKKIGVERNKILNDVIYSREYGATIWQVDPTLSRAKAKEKYENKTSSGKNLFEVWKKQQVQWKALGQDGQEAYTTMRDMYRKQYLKMKDTLDMRIDNALSDSPTDAQAIKGSELYKQLFEKATLDVYFPLVRNGKYKIQYSFVEGAIVGGKEISKKDEFVVERFEHFRERDAIFERLRNDPNVDQSTLKKNDGNDDFKNLKVAPTSFVGQTMGVLDANNVSQETKEEILRLFIDTLPETAFARSLQKRKGTPGYIPDALYAMRTKGYDIGRQTARLEHGAKIQAVQDAVEITDVDTDFGAEVKRQLIDRARFARNGAKNKAFERVVRNVNQIAFIYTLGLNTASALVNLSQIPLFVLPMMGGKYGITKSSTSLTHASKLVVGSKNDISSYYDMSDDGEFTVRRDLKLERKQLKELEELAPLVKLASQRGQLTRAFLADALGLDEGGRESHGNKFESTMNKAAAVSALMFNHAERFNRQTTLISSYQLALEDIKTKKPNLSLAEQQELAAEQALYDAQEYNGGSVLETAPRISQEGVGRVAMMYKTYGLRMYYTMFKTAKEMVDAQFKGDKDTRDRAFKQILGFHGSALFFAGVYGLPLYGAVQMIADLFLGDDEDDFNTIVRKEIGEGWYKGPLQDMLGINIADRVGLSNLVLQENRYNTDASLEENILFYLGGPALSIGKRFLRAQEDLAEGEIQRGIEGLLPAGLNNLLKASPLGRYQQDGGIYSRRGDPIYADMSTWEMMSQGIGFTPAEYTFRQEQNQRDKRVERAVLTTKTKLMRKYYVALRMGDFEEVQEVMDEIQKHNRKHPYAALSSEGMRSSIKSHQKTSSEMFNGVTINPLMRMAIQQSRMEYEQ
jgi:hypothetical protein